jgi:hypothetical protein
MTNKQKVKEMRDKEPTRSASSMAREIGRTRERVKQILDELGLATNFRSPMRFCVNETCEKEVPKTSKAQTCSPECFYAHRRETFNCFYCGKAKTLLKSRLAVQREKYTNLYCTKSCRSKGIWNLTLYN